MWISDKKGRGGDWNRNEEGFILMSMIISEYYTIR